VPTLTLALPFQDGYYAQRAGHDINYIAVAGVLSLLGTRIFYIPRGLFIGGGGWWWVVVVVLHESVHLVLQAGAGRTRSFRATSWGTLRAEACSVRWAFCWP
jgi:hypothetical protein